MVPAGELETWLKLLGVTGKGPSWLIDMFQALGENPESPNFVKPSAGDVWDFIGLIKLWIADPQRRGIPL